MWSLHRLSFNIHNTVEFIKSSFSSKVNVVSIDCHIKWNNNDHICVILDVDGSCLGFVVRADFGGIFRNSADFFLSAFSNHITGYFDILLVELAIYNGLIMAKYLGIGGFVCYSYFLLCPLVNYHVYAVLIQDIIDLVSRSNVSITHTLREGTNVWIFWPSLETPRILVS